MTVKRVERYDETYGIYDGTRYWFGNTLKVEFR